MVTAAPASRCPLMPSGKFVGAEPTQGLSSHAREETYEAGWSVRGCLEEEEGEEEQISTLLEQLGVAPVLGG